jgi:hypothetical protein
MTGHDPVREEIRERLQDAIDELRIQLARVEIWADALDGFSRPIPNYKPDSRFLLPGKARKDH